MSYYSRHSSNHPKCQSCCYALQTLLHYSLRHHLSPSLSLSLLDSRQVREPILGNNRGQVAIYQTEDSLFLPPSMTECTSSGQYRQSC